MTNNSNHMDDIHPDVAGNDLASGFVTSFLRSQNSLYSYVYAVAPDWDAADEIFQRVALALWSKRDSYDSSRPFIQWAMGFAKLEVKKYVSEQHRQPLTLNEDAIDCLTRQFLGDETIESKLEALNECLAGLSERQRNLISRCYSSRQKIQEVAESLSLSANAVYLQLKRIREALYDCIMHRVSSRNLVTLTPVMTPPDQLHGA